MKKALALLLVLACSAAQAQAPAAGLPRIGAAAAVKGLVNAQAPGEAVGRVLGSGKPVFLNDHVTTDASGRLQIMLLDETVFTIGPSSDMVLDEFVYDPATSAGKVTAQVTKGVFRFVTGKVARKDPGSMKVKLPVGTMGIRGTIAGGQVSDQGSTVILFGPGANNNANENPGSVAVGNAGSEVVLSQPGYGTTILPGQPPSSPTDMSGQAGQISGALGEPAPQGGSSSDGGGSGSASSQAGQDTAAGGVSAGISGDLGDFTSTLDTTQNTASQQEASTPTGILDGVSSWEQVINTTLAGLGPGTYSAAGTASCSGALCTGSEDFTTSASVDFAARTLSGNVNISNMEVGTLGGSASTSFSSSFGTTGNAVITLDSVAHGSASTFDGTQLSFMNRGGVAAQDLKTDLHYYYYDTNSGGTTITGTATAVFNPQPQ